MRRKLVASLLLALAPALLFAQTRVRLEFADAGEREVWVAPDWPRERPADTQALDGKSFDVPISASQAGEKLFIWDKGTGNVAAKAIKPLNGRWKVAASDYQRIGQITLRVEHGGDPVSAAQVFVKAKGYTDDEFIDPSSKGELVLYGVPPGELEVTVKYKAKEQGSKSLTQQFPMALQRDTPDPTLAISIVDDVDTVAAPTKPADSQRPAGTAPKDDGGGSIFSLLLTYGIALGLAIGAGYFILNYIRNNKDAVQQKLESLGVQMPDAAGAAATAAPAANPIAPEPPQKIILDDAAPVPPAGTIDPYAPAAVIPVAASGHPRLVGEDGRTFDIEEGLFAVGREDGLPLSIPGESTVSRRHAELTRTGAEVIVTDLGSTNGTYVNGQKVQGDVQLRPGDTVQFGAIRFRFEG